MTATNAKVQEIIESILKEYPFITTGLVNSYPAFCINNKPFLFIHESGIAIKVHLPMANLLHFLYDYQFFDPNWLPADETWIMISKKTPLAYLDDRNIIKEAVGFATGIVTSRSFLSLPSSKK